MPPIQEKPMFSVNPPIIVAMNDKMAQELIDTLNFLLENGEMLPSSVFAFKKTLENDLKE